MKNLQTSETEPLDGEVLDPQPDRDEALSFLAGHGVQPPRVRSYRSMREAIAAIIAAEIGVPPREGGR